MPLEDFILKWLPVSDRFYSYSRFISELLIYALLIMVLMDKKMKGYKLNRSPIDISFFLFVTVGILSIIINEAPLLGGLLGIRTLLRYVAVYYVIINLNMNPLLVRRLLLLIIFVGVGESMIAIAQHFSGISSFWLPRETNLEIAGYTKAFVILKGGAEKGAAIGTFGQSVSMALYLLIAFIIFLSLLNSPSQFQGKKKKLILAGVLIISLAILYTYSRGVTLSAMLTVPVILLAMNNKKTIKIFISLGFLFTLIIATTFILSDFNIGTRVKDVKTEYVGPIENMRMIFSSEYIDKTKGSRQWVLKEVGGAIIKSFKLIGFSPDEHTAKEHLSKLPGGTLRKLVRFVAFEDVYWVAILAYFGLIGLSVFLYILFRLFRSARFVYHNTEHETFRIVAVTVITLIVIIMPLTFLVRTFEFRPFAFHFWVLSGLMMNEYIALRIRRRNTLNENIASK